MKEPLNFKPRIFPLTPEMQDARVVRQQTIGIEGLLKTHVGPEFGKGLFLWN